MIFRALLILFALACPAIAQEHDHDHDLGHVQYRLWYSNEGFNCCNDQDCGYVADDHLREQAGKTEILVEDPAGNQWCPVEERHLINQTGGPRQSPDWSRAHACILGPMNGRDACERFKCFMSAAKF